MAHRERDWLRWSLVFVWLATACASVWELDGQSSALLAAAGIHHPMWVRWLLLSAGLFVMAGLCWLPVVWLQIQMAAMAQAAAQSGEALPSRYWRFARWWEWLGYPAFVAMLAVFYLMVAKPNF